MSLLLPTAKDHALVEVHRALQHYLGSGKIAGLLHHITE
jgi:hypothetical protein